MRSSNSRIQLPQTILGPVKAAQHTVCDAEARIVLVGRNEVCLIDLEGRIRANWKLPDSMHQDCLLEIHCRENFITIVEARGLNGIVLRADDTQWQMELAREDYHCSQCTWPIGYFERDQKLFLIHATQWNRLDITCLESSKCLTDREIVCQEKNYMEYFHSNLYVSPDEKHFVVNGWVWSPWDVLYVWNIDQFKVDYEPGGVCLNALDRNGYNWDRPCCFVDNKTIAWGYNEREADNLGVPEDQGTELIFQNIHSKKIVRRMPFEFFDLTSVKEAYGRLWFDSERDLFVCSSRRAHSAEINERHGTHVIDSSGTELHHWPQVAEFVSTDHQVIGFLAGDQIEIVRYP